MEKSIDHGGRGEHGDNGCDPRAPRGKRFYTLGASD